jgi:hypothetical protein
MRAVNTYFFETFTESLPVENSVEIIERCRETLLRDSSERGLFAAFVCNQKKLFGVKKIFAAATSSAPKSLEPERLASFAFGSEAFFVPA